MSLENFQVALIKLIQGDHQSDVLSLKGQHELTALEATWLQNISATRGFDLTVRIQRRWREIRVRVGAPLTTAALGSRMTQCFEKYFARSVGTSMFFHSEALRFIDFVRCEYADDDVLQSVCRWERAASCLAQAVSMSAEEHPRNASVPDNCLLTTHPLADMILFRCSPFIVFDRVTRGKEPPKPSNEDHYMLVAPGLERLSRTATSAEAELFRRCQSSPWHHPEQTVNSATFNTLGQLWSAGALVAEGRDTSVGAAFGRRVPFPS